MTTGNEHWWERLPRIVGGWTFAILIFLKFPFPEAELVDGTVVRMRPGLTSWVVFVVLIVFSIGIAHSTVTGIVLGNLTKAWSFLKRGAKKRRSSAEALPSPGPSPGTTSGQLESTRKRDALDDVRPPKKPRGR